MAFDMHSALPPIVIGGIGILAYFWWQNRRPSGPALTAEEIRERRLAHAKRSEEAQREAVAIARSMIFDGHVVGALQSFKNHGISLLLVLDANPLESSTAAGFFADPSVRAILCADDRVLPVFLHTPAPHIQGEGAFILKALRIPPQRLPAAIFLSGALRTGAELLPHLQVHALQRATASAQREARQQAPGPHARWRQQQAAMADALTTSWLVFNGTASAQDLIGAMQNVPNVGDNLNPQGAAQQEQERQQQQELAKMQREQEQLEMAQEFAEAQAADNLREEEQSQHEEAEMLEQAIAMSMEGEKERLLQVKKRNLEEKRNHLAVEALPGPGVLKLRLKLPDGVLLSRNFADTDPLSRLFDLVEVHLQQEGGFELNLYPNTKLACCDALLRDAGLTKGCMILVALLDEEDEEEEEEY